MKKIILILLLLPLIISNVYAVGSSGSTGGESKVYAKSVKIENNPGKLRIGDKYTFKAKLYPNNASSDGITWTSSDSNILSIDNKGNAVAKNKGTVKVTVKTNNGKTAFVTVTVNLANTTSGGVKKVKTVSITSYPDEIIVGNTFQLQTEISPSLVDNDKLTFKSDNEKVLTVDKNGLITAKKKGETTITVTSANNKTAKVTIKVVNAKVTLSKSSMTINEGESKEITVKIESNKQYSESDLKWATGNVVVTKVETVSGGNNIFKAKVYGLSKGAAWISANIDGEKDRSKITVKEAGRDTSLECPLISYDTSDNEYIKINITPASSTDHFDYAVSINGMSGRNAKWGDVEANIKGNKTIFSKYDSVQGKIRIYGKSGSSRDCYTAPFDYDSSKSSKYKSYSGFTGICPSISLNKNTEYISGTKPYRIKLGGKSYVTTGIKNANLTVTPTKDTHYQYNWYSNMNGVVGYIDKNSWKLNKTFNNNSNVSLIIDDAYNHQGMILVMNELGDVRVCYTDIYNSDAYKKKITINGNTDIYVDKDYSYNSDEMINLIKSLPKYYTASPNIFLLSRNTYQKMRGGKNDSCGCAYKNDMKVLVRDGEGCDYDYAKLSIIHELGHTMDSMYSKFNENQISDEKDFSDIYNRYIKNKVNNQYKYLRTYSYASKGEFWADLVSLEYINSNSYFNNNTYKGNVLIDSSLADLNSKYLDKVKYLYSSHNSDWNKYKDMYR